MINMTERERQREKELKRLIYLRNEIIKESKKEIVEYKHELYRLGKNKTLRKKRENGTRNKIYY